MDGLVNELRGYAYEHRYEDSWDALLRWTDDQVKSAITGAKTRRGAIAKAWKHIRELDERRARGEWSVVRVYGAKPVRPESLFAILARKGGLRPDAEVSAALGGNPWVGGAGPLVRQRGMTLDAARARAVDAGYLWDTPWSGGVSVSTVNDLLDALREEAHGNKVYVMGDVPSDDDYHGDEEESFDDIPY